MKYLKCLWHNPWLVVLTTTTLLLLIPLIAMQFTTEVKWEFPDFIVAGILLLVFGFSIAFAMRRIKKPKIKIATVSLIVLILLLLWAEMAVGIFGSPLAGS